MRSILNFFNSDAGKWTVNFIVTLFGSVAMYMFSVYRGFQGAGPALKVLLPNRPQVLYDRIDFLFTVFAGSIIGTIYFHPPDPLHALFAGFGWVSALSILAKQKGPSE